MWITWWRYWKLPALQAFLSSVHCLSDNLVLYWRSVSPGFLGITTIWSQPLERLYFLSPSVFCGFFYLNLCSGEKKTLAWLDKCAHMTYWWHAAALRSWLCLVHFGFACLLWLVGFGSGQLDDRQTNTFSVGHHCLCAATHDQNQSPGNFDALIFD